MPQNGESFTQKRIAIVGGSTEMRGSAVGFSSAETVSPRVKSGMPHRETIWPAMASGISFSFTPSG